MFSQRHLAREIILQALFAKDFVRRICVEQPDASDEELLADIIQEKKKFKTVNQQNLDFIRKIFNNIDSCLEEIDSKI